MENGTSKVFISYSWSQSEKVLELAERLMNNGIAVSLDKWDLTAGQDKYAFMEQSVTDENIDKVLIICDKAYMEKANSRTGGVGDETLIISPEIYGKVTQEKFIPVIFEVDENNKPYLPQYIKSRIYFDLSSDEIYENGYESLLRNIVNKPLYKKPALGILPEWLENDTVNFSPLKISIKQIRNFSGDKDRIKFLIIQTIDNFINTLNEVKDLHLGSENLLKKIEETKPIHDLFVDFVDSFIYSGFPIYETITDFFEKCYNSVYEIPSEQSSYYSNIFEYYNFFFMEAFISMTAILLHYEKYAELNKILNHTYFLRDSYFSTLNIKPQNFIFFQKYLKSIEQICKPRSEKHNLYSLTGDIMIHREIKPILTSINIATADVILYQLSKIFYYGSDEYTHYWFPDTYYYKENSGGFWIKLHSKTFCNKIMPLFGVSTIEKLKEKVMLCEFDRKYHYSNDFNCASVILNYIKIEEIASLN